MAIGRYGIAALGWAGSVVLVHVLSQEAWGAYSLIFSIMGLVGSFADLQVGRAVVRDLLAAGDRVERTLGSFVTLRLVTGIASYGAALVVVWVGRYPPVVVAAMAVSGTVLVLAAAGSALSVYFNSQMWMRSVATAGVLGQASQLALIVALAVAGYRGLIFFMLPAVLFEIVSLGWQFHTMRGVVRIQLCFDRSRWSLWTKEALVLSIGTALGTLYLRIDTIMLSKLTDLTAVGIYAIGAKFAILAGAVSGAVYATLLVSLTKSWPDDLDAFVTAFRRAFLLLAVAGTAVALEFGAFSASIVRLLYGEQYVVGSRAAIWLVVAEVVTFISDLCFVALVAMGRNLAYVVAAGLGVLVNVGINLILIPRWSYNGASVATLLTEVLVLAILAGVLWHRAPAGEWMPWRGIAKVCVAGGAMAATAFSLRAYVPWVIAAVAAVAVYAVILHVIRVDGPDGIRALAR